MQQHNEGRECLIKPATALDLVCEHSDRAVLADEMECPPSYRAATGCWS